MLINKMINYQQAYRHNREDGDAPRDYYDPNILLADKHYRIGPKENIMIVINGSGYHYNDDTVYALGVPPVIDNTATTTTNYLQLGQAYQMCLLVKNCSSVHSIYVGNKSALQWLLDMPRVTSKLSFCTYGELTRLRYSLRDTDCDDDCVGGGCGDSGKDVVDNNVPMFTAAADESIVINY